LSLARRTAVGVDQANIHIAGKTRIERGAAEIGFARGGAAAIGGAATMGGAKIVNAIAIAVAVEIAAPIIGVGHAAGADGIGGVTFGAGHGAAGIAGGILHPAGVTQSGGACGARTAGGGHATKGAEVGGSRTGNAGGDPAAEGGAFIAACAIAILAATIAADSIPAHIAATLRRRSAGAIASQIVTRGILGHAYIVGAGAAAGSTVIAVGAGAANEIRRAIVLVAAKARADPSAGAVADAETRVTGRGAITCIGGVGANRADIAVIVGDAGARAGIAIVSEVGTIVAHRAPAHAITAAVGFGATVGIADQGGRTAVGIHQAIARFAAILRITE